MKKILLLGLMSFISVIIVLGQNDPEAVRILDKFSETATSAPSISMNFLLVTVDQIENSTDTLSGSVILAGDSYKLELPDNIIWYNGEISWSYLPAEQEVTITKPDKEANSFESRPSMIFNMYKKDFKSRLLEERSDSYLIDLYPEEIQNDLIRVRLTIAKPSLDLQTFEYKRRDGITLTLLVKDYNLKKVPESGMFVFTPSKYKGVEVIDMR
jgi:outer membrane lipoprotein carrier protein